MIEQDYEFYLQHTVPNDDFIRDLVNSSVILGAFRQTNSGWLFDGLCSVGHIIEIIRGNSSKYLVCFHDSPYMMFNTLEDAQLRMLALDLMKKQKFCLTL